MNAPRLALALLVLNLPPLAASADELRGRNAAALCMPCHGARGLSANGEWPNLAAQQAGYLAKQLRDFRSGSREQLIMSVVAGKLDDAQIEDLAQYFSRLGGEGAAAARD